MSAAPGSAASRDPHRVVLVETSDDLPGLLPFQAWDALATADAVLLRDADAHPSAQQLYFAGLDLEQVEPATLERDDLDLSLPGSPDDRRMAKALLTRAVERDRVVYLLGPGDETLSRVVALHAPRYDAEVEIVFLAQQPRGTAVLRLAEVMRRLRDPRDGCPWDLQQDHASLLPHLIEEAHELVEAVDSGDDAHIVEELGDVLLQVVFHAQIGDDRRAFSLDDVATGIADKLERRHPHVFADGDASTADEVQANWDELKRVEKGRAGTFDGVPAALPALAYHQRLQGKAAKRGFDWTDVEGPIEKVREELAELIEAEAPAHVEEELGDLLAVVVGVARKLDIDAELALRRASVKFRRRFDALVAGAESDGIADLTTLTADDWRQRWDAVKATEPDPAAEAADAR